MIPAHKHTNITTTTSFPAAFGAHGTTVLHYDKKTQTTLHNWPRQVAAGNTHNAANQPTPPQEGVSLGRLFRPHHFNKADASHIPAAAAAVVVPAARSPPLQPAGSSAA